MMQATIRILEEFAFNRIDQKSNCALSGCAYELVWICWRIVLKVLVETAMLAAVSGMVSLLLTLIKLDAYLYYMLPFPLVLASLRCDILGADALPSCLDCVVQHQLQLVAFINFNIVIMGGDSSPTGKLDARAKHTSQLESSKQEGGYRVQPFYSMQV